MNAPGLIVNCSSTTSTSIRHRRSIRCSLRPLRQAGSSTQPIVRTTGSALCAALSPQPRRPGFGRAGKASVDDGAPAHLAPYAGLRLAQHLVVSRERAEAREVLTSAAKLAARLGAGLLTSRLTALAQRAGLSTESPSTDGNPLAGLTAREVEVLQLVAEGKSNGEIGAALFISTKTASVHVSNILAKLGVSTRGEAAAIAHRRGLVGAV